LNGECGVERRRAFENLERSASGHVMKKRRERFDAQLAEIQRELLTIGVGVAARPANLGRSRERGGDRDRTAKRMTVTSSGLMATAYQLAGYAVATLALGRSIPGKIVLKEDAEYDLGRCSEGDLDTIWAVGNLAAERRDIDGTPAAPGPTVVIVKMESDIVGPMHGEQGMPDGAMDPDLRAKALLDENWDDIVHVARLLIDRGALSRDDIEAEVFEPGDLAPPPEWPARRSNGSTGL
jgi:hypothetical protein